MTPTAATKSKAEKSIHERIKDASDWLVAKGNVFSGFELGLQKLMDTGQAPMEVELALHLAKHNREMMMYLMLEAERKTRETK